MLARIALVCLVVATAPVIAGPAIEIHASCAADVVSDPAHLKALKSELAQSLAGAAEARAVDISLVKLETTTASSEVIVRAEVRAVISDPKGKMQWMTTARSTARGAIKERGLVQRDAISAAARQVGQNIRQRETRAASR